MDVILSKYLLESYDLSQVFLQSDHTIYWTSNLWKDLWIGLS